MAMDPKEKKRRADARFEIRARNLALRRLATPLKQAKAAADKKKEAREAKYAEWSKYTDERDAQDAYGFGMISEEEYNSILDHLEKGEDFLNQISAEEAAVQILEECIARITRQIQEFQFDLLPEEEQRRIRDQNAAILARRRGREGRDGT